MSSSWADACNHALNKTLKQQLDAARGSCGATVTRAALSVFVARCCCCM
jgi:hypothetical protein